MGRLRPTLRGGGQEAVSFGARRQCMFPYTFLLASRPQPPGPPSILICRRDRAPVLSNRLKSQEKNREFPTLLQQALLAMEGRPLHLPTCFELDSAAFRIINIVQNLEESYSFSIGSNCSTCSNNRKLEVSWQVYW